MLVATSQNLSPPQCRNIEKRAKELGFRLAHHPYTRQALAERLYHRPDLCKRLLGLSGTASPLSMAPKGYRPARDLPLIGRASDLAWLRQTKGDRLVVGQPGIGKGFLLQHLAREDHALFIIDKNIERIADAVRAQNPSALIVEDAHVQLAFLGDLQHLRLAAAMKFDIIADCWPGSASDVQASLHLPDSQVLRLGKLKRAEIVQIIKAVGVYGPNHLLLEIIRQSGGRPGLASLLAHFCMVGDVKSVWVGETLHREISSTIKALVGEDAALILAVFALGGRAGMPAQAVAEALGIPVGTIDLKVSKLSAGGVIKEIEKRHLISAA